MAKKDKVPKTNAVRLLEKVKIPFEIYTYETSDGRIDGISVADKTGQDPKVVYKTLVTEGDSGNLYVFCIPVEKELNLKNAAKAANEKKIIMLPVKDLFKHTGYIRGGCSPIGMKKLYPTFIDDSVQNIQYIIISGGAVGIQVKLRVEDFLEVIKVHVVDLTL